MAGSMKKAIGIWQKQGKVYCTNSAIIALHFGHSRRDRHNQFHQFGNSHRRVKMTEEKATKIQRRKTALQILKLGLQTVNGHMLHSAVPGTVTR